MCTAPNNSLTPLAPTTSIPTSAELAASSGMTAAVQSFSPSDLLCTPSLFSPDLGFNDDENVFDNAFRACNTAMESGRRDGEAGALPNTVTLQPPPAAAAPIPMYRALQPGSCSPFFGLPSQVVTPSFLMSAVPGRSLQPASTFAPTASMTGEAMATHPPASATVKTVPPAMLTGLLASAADLSRNLQLQRETASPLSPTLPVALAPDTPVSLGSASAQWSQPISPALRAFRSSLLPLSIDTSASIAAAFPASASRFGQVTPPETANSGPDDDSDRDYAADEHCKDGQANPTAQPTCAATSGANAEVGRPVSQRCAKRRQPDGEEQSPAKRRRRRAASPVASPVMANAAAATAAATFSAIAAAPAAAAASAAPAAASPPPTTANYDDTDTRGARQRSTSFAGPDEEKRSKFLERNRVAASKCRQKKKEWATNLECRARELQVEREQLSLVVASLKDEVLWLKGQMLKHDDCHCERIRRYLSREASQLVPDAPPCSALKRRFSASSPSPLAQQQQQQQQEASDEPQASLVDDAETVAAMASLSSSSSGRGRYVAGGVESPMQRLAGASSLSCSSSPLSPVRQRRASGSAASAALIRDDFTDMEE